MQAQRYRHRIEFQERVETQDSETGAVSAVWQTVEYSSDYALSAVPAEVLTGPGREFNAADAKQAETSARINCRWFGDVDPAWRVLWNGYTYDILSVEYDATARRETRLRVKQGVSDGG